MHVPLLRVCGISALLLLAFGVEPTGDLSRSFLADLQAQDAEKTSPPEVKPDVKNGETTPATDDKPAEEKAAPEGGEKPEQDKEAKQSDKEQASPEGSPNSDSKTAEEAKSKEKKAKGNQKKSTSSVGNILNGIGGMLRGGGTASFQAPKNPVEAVEASFTQLEQQLNQPRYVVGSVGKPQIESNAKKESVGLPDEEKKELVKLVDEAAPVGEYEKLPEKRRQEVLQHIQNSTHYWMNQRNWGTLADEKYRLAGRDVLILGLKRLMKMPVIEAEDPEAVKKQLDEWCELVFSKVPQGFHEFLSEEPVKKSFLQNVRQQMEYQMNRTDNLSFKVVTPKSELSASLKTLDKNLEQFAKNNNNKPEDILRRYGLGDILSKTGEERKKLMAGPQGMQFGQQIYYAIYPLQQFGQSLATVSSGYAKRTKFGELDMTGGVSVSEMGKVTRKYQQLQQKMWNDQREAARPDIKDPAGIVKYAFEQIGRYNGRGNQLKEKLTPEQVEERKNSVKESISKILVDELPGETYQGLAPARQGRILQEAQNSVAQALAYNSPEKLSSEEVESALMNLKIAVRESVKMPVLEPEARDMTEKQIDQFVSSLIELMKSVEPELMAHEVLRDSVAESWKSELTSKLEDSQTAAFKTPMTPERFQAFIAQLPIKFKVFAASEKNQQNYYQNQFDPVGFKKMEAKEQASLLEDPNTFQMVSSLLTSRCSRLIENAARESADYAKGTRFKSADLTGGISDEERKQQNRLADTARQIRYDRYVAGDPAAAKREFERTGHNKIFMEEEAQKLRAFWKRTQWLSGGIISLVCMLLVIRQFRKSSQARRAEKTSEST